MLSTLENALNAEYEAYVDEVITDPLIEKLPKPGKIKAQSEGKFGTTELLLSNGVRVIVKPTDFKADEIRFTAFRNGGKRSYLNHRLQMFFLWKMHSLQVKLGTLTMSS